MSKRPKVMAAGGVVLREFEGEQQVLLIHRRKYDDWSLPKGKGMTDEYLPETAVREIYEETGVRVRLDLRLSTIRYKVPKGRKDVHYWRAGVITQEHRDPDDEVERAEWFNAAKALKKASYDDDRALIREALAAPPTNVLLLVRHGKAMLRKDWSGPDQKRRLTGRGRKQAKVLVRLLEVFGVQRLHSSSARRCMDTLLPYAEAHGLVVDGIDLFTEEEGTKHPGQVAARMARLSAEVSAPTAVCGHRPVLPSMYTGLGLEPRPMVVGEALAVHLDPDGKIVRWEIIKPTV